LKIIQVVGLMYSEHKSRKSNQIKSKENLTLDLERRAAGFLGICSIKEKLLASRAKIDESETFGARASDLRSRN
jgi:hypothetical protein